jgi:hypothetical protein
MNTRGRFGCSVRRTRTVDQLVPNGLLGVGGAGTKSRQAIDHVGDEMKVIEVVPDDHVEGSGRRPFFCVTAHSLSVVKSTSNSWSLNPRALCCPIDESLHVEGWLIPAAVDVQ